jgi:hypothetical protein
MHMRSSDAIRQIAVLASILFGALLTAPAAFAADAMPLARQNALVAKYCAVCHTDAARSGGLSLEHFDAAQAPPSLAAMMVSKLTGGASLETARTVASDPRAAALVSKKMRSGAMGAAGIPIPDIATIDALIAALTSEAEDSQQWSVSFADPRSKQPFVSASILREAMPATNPGEAGMYRLVVGCNADTGEGSMQLAWAPAAKTGSLSAAFDGKKPLTYMVEGSDLMMGSLGPMLLPAQTLAIGDLFPDQKVEFPFRDLPRAARQALAACFPGR